jgi:tripartite-type tricarboxylate transporter receptor subunit TctC
MLGGHVDFATGYLPEYKGLLDAGKLKVVAQTGTERSPYLQNVPTFTEVLKLDNVRWSVFRYACVPKGTPKERMNYLAAAIDAALHDPDCIKDYEKAGIKVGIKFLDGKKNDEMLDSIHKNYRDFFIKTKRMTP